MKKILSIILAMALVFCVSMSAFAATEGSVTVNGHIGTSGDPTIDPGGDPDDPDGDYDLTFSTGVHWWVTQTSYPNILNGDSLGPNPLAVNKIVNNSAADMDVSFVSFTGINPDATAIASDLNLCLTDDLAADSIGSQNLSGGYSTQTDYTAPLAADSTWTYGFTGTYNATTVNTSYGPTYTLILEFGFKTAI